MLSVIIPSRNEQAYLESTIKNVLLNAEGEIEIIVILDGWLPEPAITVECGDNQSIRWIHNEESIGQRQAINQACREANGKYMMKLDAHCAVSKGFDTILKRDCEYDITMVPRMYNLDVTDWTPKKHKRTDYMYIGWKDGWMRAQYYQGENKEGNYKRAPLIDDTMCCMGPGWFMHMDRFWELGGCDEGHGGWGQQGIEVACKAWLSGGRLVVNKNCWFAHFFRGGGVPEGHKKGFPYSIRQSAINKAREWSHKMWLDGEWKDSEWAKNLPVKRDIEWMVEKFNPPGWDKKQDDIHKRYFDYITTEGSYPHWLGFKVVKYPTDLISYQQVLFDKRPDVLVEIGTHKGGSALFFASIMDMIGHGVVLSIDRKHKYPLPKHDRIAFYQGRSTATETIAFVKEFCKGKSVMVVLDGNHHKRQVKRELSRYAQIVTPGQLMVAEDTIMDMVGMKDGPIGAVNWFLPRAKGFKRVDIEKQFMLTTSPEGWLERVA